MQKLAAIDRLQLSPEVAIDYQILQNSLNDDLLLNGKLSQWKHNPDGYSQAATGDCERPPECLDRSSSNP